MSTVNQAFKRFFPEYAISHKLSSQQAKAAKNIMQCKTSAMGGNASVCHECGHTEIHYNSCRDRHCPLCQGVTKAVWVDQRCKEVLNTPYFHVVFTIPEQLRMVTYHNKKLLYNLLYKAVSETILELSNNPKYLGAKPGFFCILHTWAQSLDYHPHMHAVVTGGGLTEYNKWLGCRKKFFIPVKVLSKKFRGKYLHYLKQYYQQGKLNFYGDEQRLEDPREFQSLVDTCYSKDWYSYCQETFTGPVKVLEYLGRYTNRIAISNSRMTSVDQDVVTFKVRNNKNVGKAKSLTLKGTEFIRRFLMHILPRGFVKVRYYGIMAHRNKKTKLSLCRKLTNSLKYKPKYEGLTTIEVLCKLLERDVMACRKCGNKLSVGPIGASP